MLIDHGAKIDSIDDDILTLCDCAVQQICEYHSIACDLRACTLGGRKATTGPGCKDQYRDNSIVRRHNGLVEGTALAVRRIRLIDLIMKRLKYKYYIEQTRP